MFARLITLILSIGFAACVLLTLRQHRLQAAHELAEVARRIDEHDRVLWRLRVEVAGRVTPQRVYQLARMLGPLAPIEIDRWEGTPRIEVAAGEPHIVRPINHVTRPLPGDTR